MRTMIVAFIGFTLMMPAVPLGAQQPYVLGPEDVIEIAVYGHADLTRIVTVLPDGTIAVPLVGIIRVAGMTLEELTKNLADAFGLYIKNPQVAVIIRGFRKIRVSVMGQVTRPGTYELRPGATVLDALSAAGGLSDKASVTDARLIPATGESRPLHLEELLIRQEMRYNVTLQGGETLMVPEELRNRFFVLGDVGSPGAYVLRGDITVLQALAQAAGPVQRGAATSRTAHVVRRNGSAPPGAKVEKLPNNGILITVDLQAIMRGDLGKDLAVQPGDIIVVPQAGLSGLQTVVSILAGLATIFK